MYIHVIVAIVNVRIHLVRHRLSACNVHVADTCNCNVCERNLSSRMSFKEVAGGT